MNEEKIFLTPKELAERWKISLATLANYRSSGKRPPYRKMNGSVRYDLDDIVQVEEEAKVRL
tara:strand:- start:89 stop:274 length:186 start_codon:yes stop_codon:yes gene_type:complete